MSKQLHPLPSSAQEQVIGWRKHVDPPSIWISVFAGSLLIHLFLLIAFKIAAARISTTQQESPIAIDLIEVAPGSSELAEVPPIADTPVGELAPSSSSSATSPSTTSEISAAPESAIAPNSPAANPTNPAQLSPETTSPVQPFTPAGQLSPSQAPTTPPNETTLPPQTNERPPTSTNPEPDPNPSPIFPEANPTPTGEPGTDSPAEPTDSNQPNTSPDAGGDVAQLPEIPVERDVLPAGVAVSLGGVRIPAGVPDPPQYPAQPTINNQSFPSDGSGSGCLLNPESTHYLGQAVVLRIAVDEQGKVIADATAVQQSSGSAEYDQLAACLIGGWQFDAAANIVNGQRDTVASNLDVQVIVNPI